MRNRALVLCVGLPVSMAVAQVEVQKDDRGYKAIAVVGDVAAGGAHQGQTRANWSSLGPYGGDVFGIAASPTTPTVVLAGLAPAGSSGGSMYRSTDGGANWTIVSQLSSNSVFDIEFTPSGTAYAGTMDGVWRSTDGGATWTQLAMGLGLNDQTFEVTIDPTNPSIIWAGIADAIGSQPLVVMKSIDGGTSWVSKTPPLASPQGCKGIAINAGNTMEMAACFAGAFGGGQMWVSTDGGESWTDRSAGLPTTPQNSVVHDGARFIVCGGQQFGSQNFGVYASPDLGITWNALHSAWPSLAVQDVALDPTNPAVVYAATVLGVHRSTNGGATWQLQAGGTAQISANVVRHAPGSATTVFVGGSSVGVYKSTDAAATFTASSTGIGALDVFSVAANPLNLDDMAIAFQGLNNGGVYRSTNGGQTWSLEGAPPVRYNTVGYAFDGTLYAISDGPTGSFQESLYRRNANGTWTHIGPNQGPNYDCELSALRFSPNNPQLIMTGGGDFGSVFGFEGVIWRSNDAGQTWAKVYETVEPSKPVVDIEIIEDGTDQTMVASHLDFTGGRIGNVVRSTDNGQTWAVSNAGLPTLIQPQSLANASGAPGTLYLSNNDNGAGSGLYKSIDGGQSWAPTGFVNTIKFMDADATDPQTLYMVRQGTGGVQDRVHKSTDGGATFSLFSDGLPAQNGFAHSLVYAGGASPKLLMSTSKGTFSLPLGSACYANCDGSTTAPTLNVADFTCFLQRFAAGDSYANCDNSTTAPVLNVADFTCFLQSFAAGCR